MVSIKWAAVEHLFAHELGHNMGCDHGRENTTGLRLFDFSYGSRFTGGSRTVEVRLSPDASYDVAPAGTAAFALPP